MPERRMLTLAEREEIALANARGEGVRAIARLVGRDQSVISRELARNTSKRGYRATTAHQRAKARRARPQQRLMDTDPVIRQRVLRNTPPKTNSRVIMTVSWRATSQVRARSSARSPSGP
ncbi:helix-turn-helix domain-containing protein [Nocardiopsis sp. CNT312]|uniref:helix-turn-helix domain-containing protein n=4 Tax=Nocardiopsis sp. CNT312 TaxID=1137268 RepID=UPI0035103CF2